MDRIGSDGIGLDWIEIGWDGIKSTVVAGIIIIRMVPIGLYIIHRTRHTVQY